MLRNTIRCPEAQLYAQKHNSGDAQKHNWMFRSTMRCSEAHLDLQKLNLMPRSTIQKSRVFEKRDGTDGRTGTDGRNIGRMQRSNMCMFFVTVFSVGGPSSTKQFRSKHPVRSEAHIDFVTHSYMFRNTMRYSEVQPEAQGYAQKRNWMLRSTIRCSEAQLDAQKHNSEEQSL